MLRYRVRTGVRYSQTNSAKYCQNIEARAGCAVKCQPRFERVRKVEARNRRTKVVVSVLALAVLLAFSLLATGGNLEPSAPPGPTMKSLDEVYNAVTSGMFNREGYCQYFTVTGGSAGTQILTVPAGRRFVLRKLYVQHSNDGYNDHWHLTAGGTSVEGRWLRPESTSSGAQFMHDFPDGCVVVNAGETLTAYKETPYYDCTMNILVIGYFHDVQ